MIFLSASCATIIRLRYLTLYNNQAEFMYSAGPIGLWSIIEEGIGIVAGSMPALRPLLSLPFFGGSRGSSKGLSEPEASAYAWAGESESRPGPNRVVKMDTFEAGKQTKKIRISKDGDSDGESQTYILKETRVTVSREVSSMGHEAWTERRVNGWNNTGRRG